MEYVLVTGGSGAIGGAVCRLLPTLGYRAIVGYARGVERAAIVADACGGIPLALELADDASIDAAVERLVAEQISLAGVVSAASPSPHVAPYLHQSEEHRRLQWRINVEGPARLLQSLIAKSFRPRKSGFVVGVLSEALGLDGPPAPQMSSYVIAKYGQLGLLTALGAEYSWLTTATVCPGFTETPMLSAFDPRMLELLRSRRAFQTPEAVAAAILAKFPETLRRAS